MLISVADSEIGTSLKIKNASKTPDEKPVEARYFNLLKWLFHKIIMAGVRSLTAVSTSVHHF